MAITHLTKDNFDSIVVNHEMVVIDFWAEWCGPCKAFAPIFEEVANQYLDITFAKINIEQECELAGAFNIVSIPMLMIMRQNIIVFAQAGLMSASALEDLIEQAKGLDMEKVKQEIKDQG